MFRIVPFEEIDKNRWNGGIHYALNGNVFGYYWYLKAVIGEWDAVIEEDYQSVMPIFRSPLRPYQYDLLMELGPYSVNPLTDGRISAIVDLFKRANKSSRYPMHSHLTKSQLHNTNTVKRNKAVLSGGTSYAQLSKTYSDRLKKNLTVDGYEKVKVAAGIKPEVLVSLLPDSEAKKNALMRVMYNAMHRGIGFSSAIEDKKSGKILAASFFVNTNTCIYEIMHYDKGGSKYRQLIYDLLLRKSAGSPVRFETFFNVDTLHEMGFDSEPVFDILLKRSVFSNIIKSFGGTY